MQQPSHTQPPWRKDQLQTALPWDNTYFRQAPAKVFWALISHGTQQQTESSCSVATAAVVLNALGWLGGGVPTKFWSEGRLLRKLGDDDWLKAAMSGGVGISLEGFAERLRRCVEYTNPNWEVVAHCSLPDYPIAKELKRALLNMERQADTIVVGNYHFASLYKNEDPDGHYSPIGAYDEVSNRILVLDVYNDYPPTWVNFEDFITAISIPDEEDAQPRGFLELRLRRGENSAISAT